MERYALLSNFFLKRVPHIVALCCAMSMRKLIESHLSSCIASARVDMSCYGKCSKILNTVFVWHKGLGKQDRPRSGCF